MLISLQKDKYLANTLKEPDLHLDIQSQLGSSNMLFDLINCMCQSCTALWNWELNKHNLIIELIKFKSYLLGIFDTVLLAYRNSSQSGCMQSDLAQFEHESNP